MNNSTQLFPLTAAIPIIKRLTGYDADTYDVIEMGNLCISDIGNRKVRTYMYVSTITDYHVELPCPIYKIESVTRFYDHAAVAHYASALLSAGHVEVQPKPASETYQPVADTAIYYNLPLPTTNESVNYILTPKGEYVDYIYEGNCLHFNITNTEVVVVYNAEVMDKNDIPLVDQATLVAVAYYYNYVKALHHDNFNMAGGSSSLATALELKDRHIAKARYAGGFSDNAFSKFLDIYTSHHRHRYNDSFKFKR